MPSCILIESVFVLTYCDQLFFSRLLIDVVLSNTEYTATYVLFGLFFFKFILKKLALHIFIYYNEQVTMLGRHESFIAYVNAQD